MLKTIWQVTLATHLAAEAALRGDELVLAPDLVLVAHREHGHVPDVPGRQRAGQRREAVARAHQLVAGGAAALVAVAQRRAAEQARGARAPARQLEHGATCRHAFTFFKLCLVWKLQCHTWPISRKKRGAVSFHCTMINQDINTFFAAYWLFRNTRKKNYK